MDDMDSDSMMDTSDAPAVNADGLPGMLFYCLKPLVIYEKFERPITLVCLFFLVELCLFHIVSEV